MSQIGKSVQLKGQNKIFISVNVVAIITRALHSLGLRKERLHLIRTGAKLNVCSCGTLLMKGSNSLDSLSFLFSTDSGKFASGNSTRAVPCAVAHGKRRPSRKELTMLGRLQSSQIKRLKTKTFLLTLKSKGSWC